MALLNRIRATWWVNSERLGLGCHLKSRHLVEGVSLLPNLLGLLHPSRRRPLQAWRFALLSLLPRLHFQLSIWELRVRRFPSQELGVDAGNFMRVRRKTMVFPRVNCQLKPIILCQLLYGLSLVALSIPHLDERPVQILLLIIASRGFDFHASIVTGLLHVLVLAQFNRMVSAFKRCNAAW